MVNLLWSNPLPTPQFASLSILLQLDIPKQYSSTNDDDSNSDDDSQHGGNIIRNISSDEIAALANDNDNNNNSSNLRVSSTLVQLGEEGGTKEVPLYPKGLVVN